MIRNLHDSDYMKEKKLEENLISGCIAHDQRAQKELYFRMLPYLSAICVRYLRNTSYEKDVLQESFVKIFKNIEKFDSKKASFRTWAAKIVINTCINSNNRVQIKNTDEFDLTIHEKVEHPVVSENFTDDRLLRILKKMPKHYFEVFNLFIIEGYKHKEISEMLNISEDVSRKRLSKGRKWLNQLNSVTNSGHAK